MNAAFNATDLCHRTPFTFTVHSFRTLCSDLRNCRDPQRMRYVKLSDGGPTDNQGLASILISRTIAGKS